MRNPQFYVFGKRPIAQFSAYQAKNAIGEAKTYKATEVKANIFLATTLHMLPMQWLHIHTKQ